MDPLTDVLITKVHDSFDLLSKMLVLIIIYVNPKRGGGAATDHWESLCLTIDHFNRHIAYFGTSSFPLAANLHRQYIHFGYITAHCHIGLDLSLSVAF